MMFKIFRWNVLIKHNPGHFFNCFCFPYLSGISVDTESGLSFPLTSDRDPVLYRCREARFLVRELRRAGYCAYKRPWILFAIRQRNIAKRSSAWK